MGHPSLNATRLTELPFRAPTCADYAPAYFIDRTRLFPFASDLVMTMALPIVLYWLYAGFYHLIDHLRLPFIEKYRLHEPEEITKRNKVTLREVVYAVILQHIVQAALGLLFLEDDALDISVANHDAALARYASRLAHYGLAIFGHRTGARLLMRYGAATTQMMYWWVVPASQLLFSGFVLDTWQYLVHRSMHINKWLYRHIHARHHRLYVPYAVGALYNHPLEGLIMDSCGGLIAHVAACLTTRQDMLLFSISSLKTVDDHCGLALPWNPFQLLCGNNADYHDIHHQQFGIKKNFSQPWFIHWDVVLGTRMTRDQAPNKSHTDLRDPNVKQGRGSKNVLVNRKTQ